MLVTPLTLKRSWLFSVFGIAPLALLVVFIDRTYYDGALLPYMGINSLLLPLYLLFFELPHVISSFLGFFDSEYVEHYRRQLSIGIPILLLVTTFLILWNITAVIVLYLVLTMYHVTRQQTGIALILGAQRDVAFRIWSWVGIVVATLIYLALFTAHLIPTALVSVVVAVVPILILLFSIIGIWYAHTARETKAWPYILGTVAMVVTSFSLLDSAYVFLAVFVLRFAHDVIAFCFYVTHEYNRNHDIVKNPLYTFLPSRPWSILLCVPLFGILIGLTLREALPSLSVLFVVNVYLAFAHYYFESFMWKRGSLHRKYIRIA